MQCASMSKKKSDPEHRMAQVIIRYKTFVRTTVCCWWTLIFVTKSDISSPGVLRLHSIELTPIAVPSVTSDTNQSMFVDHFGAHLWTQTMLWSELAFLCLSVVTQTRKPLFSHIRYWIIKSKLPIRWSSQQNVHDPTEHRERIRGPHAAAAVTQGFLSHKPYKLWMSSISVALLEAIRFILPNAT